MKDYFGKKIKVGDVCMMLPDNYFVNPLQPNSLYIYRGSSEWEGISIKNNHYERWKCSFPHECMVRIGTPQWPFEEKGGKK